MRSEDEIREEIQDLKDDWKTCLDKNSCYAGMIMGKVDALEWVLEDTECTQ